MDRQFLTLLVEPIRHDLGLSDVAISLLQGLAFVLFYSIMSLPLAALADRYNRKNIIFAGIALWSFMTAMCGMANNFLSLFLVRLGVGVGEAALTPSALSIIADSFPRDKVTRAVGVFMLATQLGPGTALIFGGAIAAAFSHPVTVPWLGTLKPWQIPFIVAGAVGIPFALLVGALKEPPRNPATRKEGSIGALSRQIKTYSRWYLALLGGTAVNATANFAALSWVPAIFMRVYGWPIGTVGLVNGIIVGVAGGAGNLTGTYLADRWRRHEIATAIPRVMALGAGMSIPFALALLTHNIWAFLASLSLFCFFNSMPYGVCNAALQLTTPNRLRAKAAAINMLVSNLLAMVAGPTIVALITQYVLADPQRVAISVAITASGTGMIAVGLILSGFPGYLRALAAAEAAGSTAFTVVTAE
jgi:MFS family permease